MASHARRGVMAGPPGVLHAVKRQSRNERSASQLISRPAAGLYDALLQNPPQRGREVLKLLWCPVSEGRRIAEQMLDLTGDSRSVHQPEHP